MKPGEVAAAEGPGPEAQGLGLVKFSQGSGPLLGPGEPMSGTWTPGERRGYLGTAVSGLRHCLGHRPFQTQASLL